MTLSTRLRAACAVGAMLALAACTSTSADGPTPTSASTTPSASVVDPSTAPPTSPASPTASVAEPSAATMSSLDPAAQEAADRAAIEAQWTKFWQVYTAIVRTPADQRSVVLDDVSVEPAKSRVLGAASKFDAEGMDYYGEVVLRPFAIDLDPSGTQAVLSDCQDQSGYGSIYVATGEKRTVGVDHNHTQAGFTRGADGVWRVQNIQYVENVPC